ncbi:hypothetical protein G4G27_07185 [Sphingomonas sp. So64.6b]|uniref:hypothetical protein n=1 Tax=Sphingomonas sp. So64.6b TaxID=2997354 RepID=UPI0016009276|nr:hypothetical protein [Sphingomonas sp. So64.6b]QNA83793.1 hypothetical protein G4G27_07185 [Sphingomonas sp. So64.6b]
MATKKWPEIPKDAIRWVRSVFAEANRKATERLINVPNIRETSLDDGLIEAITPLSAPRLLPSGAVVELQVHNIGGLRRVGKWETADIAILVFIYDHNQLVAQKIGLLQSKRLYPLNGDVDDADPLGFAYGMNAFLHRQPGSPLGILRRKFEFDESSVYGALHAGDKQVEVIDDFNKQFGEAIYYLFYNPPDLPSTMHYPATELRTVTEPPLGCRVFTADEVHAVLDTLDNGHNPSIGELQTEAELSNWRLETWVADLLLACKVGQQFDETREELVSRLIERRSGPIGAAIAVSIALPQEG